MNRPAKDQAAAIARYFVETPLALYPASGRSAGPEEALAIARLFPGATFEELRRGADIASEVLAADLGAAEVQGDSYDTNTLKQRGRSE